MLVEKKVGFILLKLKLNNMKKYPNLCDLLGEVFGGNKSMTNTELLNQAVEGDFSENDLAIMEQSIIKHPKYIKDGLPFPGDEKEYDKLIKSD